MLADEMELVLNSKKRSSKYPDSVSLHIWAHAGGSEYYEEPTLILDCDPIGTNTEMTFLELEIPGRETYTEMHDFLTHHLMKDDETKRAIDIPVNDGTRVTTRANGRRREEEGLESIRLTANAERISFGPISTMTPYIRFYEEATDDGPQDRRNAERLLTFLDELAADPTDTIAPSLHDGELIERCLPIFERGDYSEAARLAGQLLEERVREASPDDIAEADGTSLMQQAFSPDGGPLRLATDSGEQQGVMQLFAGTYLGVRNPLSHRTPDPDGEEYLDDLDETQTRNILHLCDFLLTNLERHHGPVRE